MPDMSPKKVAIPEQEPTVRNKNFKEVSLGYTLEMAQQEADRCLNCKNSPCTKGCPVNVQIPDFIKLIKDGDIDVQTYVKNNGGVVKSMVRFEVGEGMQKREENFAEEVMSQIK